MVDSRVTLPSQPRTRIDSSHARPSIAYKMTTKDKILRVIQSLDDNASVDDVIDRLYLLRKVELGIAQADADDVIEHEQFMEELEADSAD